MLIWQDEWGSPGESLYSALLKLAMVNTLQAGELLRRVFNSPMSHGSSLAVHRRSFLETGWTTKYAADPSLQYIGAICRQSLMPESIQIASLSLDRCVRYCPACLSVGIHYAEFQIASLGRCPVHGEALRSTCRSCGAMTPRYAATVETFFSPYRCVECGLYLAGDFDIASLAGPRSQGISASHPGLQRLEKLREWLRMTVAHPLRWSEGESWLLNELEIEPASQRRKIMLECVCRSVGAPDLGFEAFDGAERYQFHKIEDARGEKTSKLPKRTSDQAAFDRVKVYKSIRRYIFREYLKPHQKCLRNPSGGATFGWLNLNSLPDARLCVWAQAWMLWRSRFETRFNQACLLRSSGPGDWKSGYAGGIWDGGLADSEWPVLVWFSFHASFRTVCAWVESRWRLLAQGSTNIDHFEFDAVPPPYHQLFSVAHHRLEVQTALIEPARSQGNAASFLVGADEGPRLADLRCVCRPFFPHS
ncbi:MAG: hypothetical protein V4646_12510 [Pseudomonadota bacterium]